MNDSPNRDVAIFTEGVQLPADERAAYLARACGGDAELRQKVEALLHTYDHVGDFLEASSQKGLHLKPEWKVQPASRRVIRIGRYKLLQQNRRRRLGSGLYG